MTAPTLEILIGQGRTFTMALQYAAESLEYRVVEAVAGLAPCRLTVPGHGLPDSWPVRIESAKAPIELNSAPNVWREAITVDANTVELNDLNLTGTKAYVGPAVLVYKQPEDLTGWVIRMQVRDSAGGGTLHLSASSDPADGAEGTIELDVANSRFTVEIPAAVTAQQQWARAIYDIEAILPDGRVIAIIAPSRATLVKEVTVWA